MSEEDKPSSILKVHVSLLGGAESSVQEVEAAAQQCNGYELEGIPLRMNVGPLPFKRDDSDFGGARDAPRSIRSRPDHRKAKKKRERGAPRFDSGNSGFRGGRSGSFNAANQLYVVNFLWDVKNLALEKIFIERGSVIEARVLYDRDRDRSRKFEFVT
uniref:RRM domain-containing protein n=1 Tax=Kalanchoe fedtschenkoi TaxID=63787 RepID=A0A7N0TT59_KALFE